MRSATFPVLSAVDASIGQTSLPFDMGQVLGLLLQIIVTGASEGTLKLQYSNDEARLPDGTGVTNWTDHPSASVDLTGGAGSFPLPVPMVFGKWGRLVYTAVSGTGAGTLTVRVSTKGL